MKTEKIIEKKSPSLFKKFLVAALILFTCVTGTEATYNSFAKTEDKISVVESITEFFEEDEPAVPVAPLVFDETHDFTTYDTLINAPYDVTYGPKWRLRITRPTGMFGSGADTASRPLLFFVPGQGEMGTNYAKLQTYGWHYWLANGWDGGVTLSNGVHYPIIITAISTNTYMNGKEVAELLTVINQIYHVKDNSIHIGGLSQGGFATSSSIYYERSSGDKFGMGIPKSLMCLQGIDEWPTGYPYTANKYGGAAWTQWASEYGGKFFGLEGTTDPRSTHTVSIQMNAGAAGSGYLGYENISGGGHCCWNTMTDPSRTSWRSTSPFGTNMTTGTSTTTMGTYKDGDNLATWALRQGDTSIVGTPATTANAGSDVAITIPPDASYISQTGSDVAGSGTITARAWTRISGPNTPTLTNNTTATVTIGNGATPLIEGTYVYRYTVTASDASTAYDEFSIVVTDGIPDGPTVTVTSTNPHTITSSSSSVTTSNTAGTGSNTILHSHLIKPTLAPINIVMWGTSTLWGGGAPTFGTGVYEIVSNFYTTNGLAANVYRAGSAGLSIFSLDIEAHFDAYSSSSVFYFDAPSNAYTSASNTATIAKFQAIKDEAIERGKEYYFSGTQPRNDFSEADRNNLVTLDALLEANFPGRIVRVMPYLGDPANTNLIKNIYDYGDAIHINSLGHAEKAKSIIAFNLMKDLASGTSTIATPTTANTNLTGLTDGTHKFIVSVKDGSGRSAYDTYTKIVNPTAPVDYYWNTTNADILINRTNYPTAKAGDRIHIANRAANARYNTFTVDGMQSEISQPTDSTQMIQILFDSDAWMDSSSTPNQNSFFNDNMGIYIRGYKARRRSDAVWNLGKYGGPSGYSSYIWIDSCYIVKSIGFDMNVHAGFTNHGGDMNLTFHDWKFSKIWIDSSYAYTSYTQIAIKFGGFFGTADTIISRDITIENSLFDHYYAGDAGLDGGQPGGGAYIGALAGLRYTIRNNRFAHFGLNTYISGHTACINLYGTADIYNNIFGPENHSNDYRGNSFGIPSWGSDYTTGLRFANNFAYHKRKYPMFECGDYLGTTPSLVAIKQNINTAYGYNNFLYRPAIGARGMAGAIHGNKAYVTACIFDMTGLTPGLIAYNNVVMGPITDTSITTPLNIYRSNNPVTFTGSNNKIYNAWASGIFVDSTDFLPDPTGELYNQGFQLPSFVLAWSYPYGNRVDGVSVDIGWKEYQIGGNNPPITFAGADQTIQYPATATLSGSATDADGTVASYLWEQYSGPNTAGISTPTTASTGITGMIVGTYVFTLTSTDDDGATSSDVVNITVEAANIPPVANAGADYTTEVAATEATLIGNGTDADGTVVGYNWIQISGPSCTISNPAPSNGITNVTGMTAGTYIFQLTVTDNQAANGTDQITIIVPNAVDFNNLWKGNKRLKLRR